MVLPILWRYNHSTYCHTEAVLGIIKPLRASFWFRTSQSWWMLQSNILSSPLPLLSAISHEYKVSSHGFLSPCQPQLCEVYRSTFFNQETVRNYPSDHSHSGFKDSVIRRSHSQHPSLLFLGQMLSVNLLIAHTSALYCITVSSRQCWTIMSVETSAVTLSVYPIRCVSLSSPFATGCPWAPPELSFSVGLLKLSTLELNPSGRHPVPTGSRWTDGTTVWVIYHIAPPSRIEGIPLSGCHKEYDLIGKVITVFRLLHSFCCFQDDINCRSP